MLLENIVAFLELFYISLRRETKEHLKTKKNLARTDLKVMLLHLQEKDIHLTISR